jgi:predicted regulator of Ras-like GTPase activity (Roadblock/LC7/MglB family)
MESLLKEINAVLGVHGSFVCYPDGSIVAKVMPSHISDEQLTLVARVAAQTFQALDISRRRTDEADLVFEQGRLVLKNLRNGILVILCARTLSLPLLNLTVTPVSKRITAELKPPKEAVVAAPPVSAPPVEAPPPPTPRVAAGTTATTVYTELEQETRQILEAARQAQVTLRALNSAAVWMSCPNYRHLLIAPEKKFLEFVTVPTHKDQLVNLFEGLGYQSNYTFNALHGESQQHYVHSQRGVSVDVFLNVFKVNHRLDLSSMLTRPLLPKEALLLARLQYVEIEPHMLGELSVLLLEFDWKGDPAAVATIVQTCTEDWGWYKTVMLNLDKIVQFAQTSLPATESKRVVELCDWLAQQINNAPKTLRWQMRAQLGDGVRWYDTPPVRYPSTLDALRHVGLQIFSRGRSV